MFNIMLMCQKWMKQCATQAIYQFGSNAGKCDCSLIDLFCFKTKFVILLYCVIVWFLAYNALTKTLLGMGKITGNNTSGTSDDAENVDGH